MTDLLFDPVTRDLVIKDGDFVVTDNPSIQNGEVMKNAHAFSTRNPIYGIGLERVINSGLSTVNFEMNRWQAQCLQDKATKASFKASQNNNITDIEIQISYV